MRERISLKALFFGGLMSKYKHLLFDVDGTLVDTFEANISSIIELLDRYMPGHGKTPDDLVCLFGLPGPECLRYLGFEGTPEELKAYLYEWLDLVRTKSHAYKVFPGVIPVLSFLKSQGYHMAVVTSRTRDVSMGGPLGSHLPEPFRPYIDRAVCANDSKRPKPFPDPILHYMEQTGAKREEILFIGDAATDLQCANAAGVDFALALWGYMGPEHLYCKHYLKSPWEVVSLISQADAERDLAAQLHNWARELNAIGQIGLTYEKDKFDKQRYERLQEMAAEMASFYVPQDAQVIKKQWEMSGYKTPQLDTRAAIFDEQGRILLVKESNSGKWNMPGGWCDENLSIVENTLKEVKEEAGLDVHAKRLIAIHNRNKHNEPQNISGCLKAFVECSIGDGTFIANEETTQSRFFAQDELPVDNLRLSTNTLEQIMMCFACHNDPDWQCVVE